VYAPATPKDEMTVNFSEVMFPTCLSDQQNATMSSRVRIGGRPIFSAWCIASAPASPPREWCRLCARDPHTFARTRRGLKWLSG
jgi:hypothetical protein